MGTSSQNVESVSQMNFQISNYAFMESHGSIKCSTEVTSYKNSSHYMRSVKKVFLLGDKAVR